MITEFDYDECAELKDRRIIAYRIPCIFNAEKYFKEITS